LNEGGRIIMIGSAVGERAVAPGLVSYAATKAAFVASPEASYTGANLTVDGGMNA
jgi:NAD(P)-dependent dehydrogenase (short-subunit alcohol dehydrogenase family)